MTEYAAPPLATTARAMATLIVTDGKMGDLAQCRGVAQALGAQVHELVVKPGKVAAFTGRLGADTGFEAMLADTQKPPTVVLASGRRTVPYIKALKKRWAGQTLTVFLKDPRTGAGVADLIWVPTHDTLRGPNVIVSDTGPHQWTDSKKARAASDLRAQLSTLPRPWLGVLLGGVSKKVPYGPGTITQLTNAITLAGEGAGSVLVTPSRRTPQALKEALPDVHPHLWMWDETGPNPYGGMLGACDALFVTGDSHNMVSEALSAGRHTQVFRPKGTPTKFAGFLNALEARGLIAPPGKADFDHTQTPIDATSTIAQAIMQALPTQQNTA